MASESDYRKFFQRFSAKPAPGSPKYVVLRDALVAAIRAGVWQAGDRLPTEQELTGITPYSLGTIQRAVQLLVQEGVVHRHQGRGSFVASTAQQIGSPWIFRFMKKDESGFAVMSTRVTGRRNVHASERLRSILRLQGNGDRLLRIDRLIYVEDAVILNRHFLDPEAVPVLAEKPLDALHGENFAGLVQSTYQLPLTKVSRSFQCAELPAPACKASGIAAGTIGLIMEIVAGTTHELPVFYQQLFIPPGTGKLYTSEDSGPSPNASPGF